MGTALLAEQGYLHFVGHHPELEEELCSWTGVSSGERFDRGDALVWAVTEFGGYRRPAVGDEMRVYRYTDAPTPDVHRCGVTVTVPIWSGGIAELGLVWSQQGAVDEGTHASQRRPQKRPVRKRTWHQRL